jgi:hypothetical protein
LQTVCRDLGDNIDQVMPVALSQFAQSNGTMAMSMDKVSAPNAEALIAKRRMEPFMANVGETFMIAGANGNKASPSPSPVATATPTPAPVFPRRTAVDLLEWDVRSSYPVLAAGRVTFNAKNLGEDDHNLSVRGGGREYGGGDLAPGDTAALSLELPPGTYTLYCPLPDHEAAGMRTEIRIR